MFPRYDKKYILFLEVPVSIQKSERSLFLQYGISCFSFNLLNFIFVPSVIYSLQYNFILVPSVIYSLQYNFIFVPSVIYPAISTFAVQICYTNKFLLYSY